MAHVVYEFPLAYFLTWTTYGTWLPGDERGWTDRAKGFRKGESDLTVRAVLRMRETAVILDAVARRKVEDTVVEHCGIRNWHLFAVSCRSNHVHAVVAADKVPEVVAGELKAYSVRRLKEEIDPTRRRWWTDRSSKRYLNSEEDLETVVRYVLDAQDRKARDDFSN